ncbi:MAG TPA: helix-turn-helix domain-containing protein [Candidatus Binataceae bacterium]|nr:helix-turn-helix domain-containing protein [Candidatus Binataceae bacterium]
MSNGRTREHCEPESALASLAVALSAIKIHGMNKTLREEHALATRDAILGAARRLFTANGYDASSIDDIAKTARVTSGALYHHFRGKREIMRAVFETLEAELKHRVSAAGKSAKTPSEAMRRSLRALFDACLEDDIRSIVFEQAPRVLGWEEWRRIDAEFAMELIMNLLSGLRQEHRIANYDDNVLAILFLAAITEAGLQIALHKNNAKLRRECERVLEAFLSGLGDR